MSEGYVETLGRGRPPDEDSPMSELFIRTSRRRRIPEGNSSTENPRGVLGVAGIPRFFGTMSWKNGTKYSGSCVSRPDQSIRGCYGARQIRNIPLIPGLNGYQNGVLESWINPERMIKG